MTTSRGMEGEVKDNKYLEIFVQKNGDFVEDLKHIGSGIGGPNGKKRQVFNMIREF